MVSADWIGWVATAVFLTSYSLKDQAKLRRVQAIAALLWVGYGAILHAVPIVVANLLVALAAVYSSLARGGTRRHPGSNPDHRISPAGEPDLSRIS
jgi:inner membrane protein